MSETPGKELALKLQFSELCLSVQIVVFHEKMRNCTYLEGHFYPVMCLYFSLRGLKERSYVLSTVFGLQFPECFKSLIGKVPCSPKIIVVVFNTSFFTFKISL
jgi:hypothetical protein